MSGIDPHAYMQQVAGRLDNLTGRGELETALDELEYLLHRANFNRLCRVLKKCN